MPYTALIKLWGDKVISGAKTINEVPIKIRKQVEEYVNQHITHI